MTDPIDLVVIGAHPDDAELGVGGTLLIAREHGQRTAVIDLTRGELSSRGDLETRGRETRDASEILGLAHRESLELEDGAVHDTPDARARLVEALRRLRPRLLLVPWCEDLHPDHAGAGLLAARSLYLCGVRRFAAGVPLRPPMLGYYMCHTPFEATAVVDVTAVWDRKMDAVRAYRSQFHDGRDGGPRTKIASPHFLQAVEGRAREYGALAGSVFGEPLRWHHPPLLVDPVAALTAPEGRER